MSINATVDGTVYEGIQTISVGGKSVVLSEVGESGEITRVSWHQCPEAVREYLAYVAEHPYSTSDNSTTYILDFAPDPAVVSNTKPVGFAVDGVTYQNNVPLVATPFATADKAGTLTALDKLRWFNTTPAPASGSPYEKGLNCRDLGGWACDGGTVKYGMLVRSGEINPADKSLMVDEVGIKTEINLLPGNVQGRDESVWGIDYVENPTDNDFMYSISSAYADQWLLYLQTAFRSAANSKPVIFHCGAGADKTATLACMLLGILGCSESDIDADYELTMFSLYQPFRNRTYAAWWGFKDAIKAVPLARGLTDSFQNRCASFAMSLGITADEINAFRTACIDGTPTAITPTLETYTITKTLDHATVDNEQASIVELSSYSANISPVLGYVINSVSVTMGGADITNRVFTGSTTVLRHSVQNNLIGCATDNAKSNVVDGDGYVAEITAEVGYTLTGATVTITMGGVNVSNYYSGGKIAIPSVTGNLSITVAAVATAPTYTNFADPSSTDWVLNKRIANDGTLKDATGAVVTNYIPCQTGDVVRVYGLGALNQYNMWICNSDKTVYSTGVPANDPNYYAYAETGIASITVRSGGTNAKYLRITGVLATSSDDVIITVNEEISQ